MMSPSSPLNNHYLAMRNLLRPVVCLLLGASVSIDWAPAQVLNRQPPSSRRQPRPQPGEQTAQDPRRTPLLQLDPATLLGDRLPPGFLGVKRNLDVFQGFPNYPPNWPLPKGWTSFGEYPSPYAVGDDGARIIFPTLPRSLPARTDAWPSWFDSRARQGETAYEVDMALLVRSTDRVWYRAAAEIAFVPLAFYDKGRVVRAGDEIDVRHKGGYELHFHGGGYLRSRGPAKLSVESLSEAVNVVNLREYQWVQLVTRLQPLRTILPDGSVLEMQGNSLVQLTQEAGIGLILHTGEGVVRLASSAASVTIPHAHRVKIYLAAGDSNPIGSELLLDSGLQAHRDGRVLVVNGGDDGGVVLWGGVRVTLQPGQELRVDPLAGSEFPEHTQNRNERN